MKPWHFLALLLFLVVGCRGAERAPVEGTITLKGGKPLPAGRIRFLLVDGTVRQVAFADIENGKYSLPAERGPWIGKNRVEITAQRKTGRKIPPPDGPPENLIDEIDQYLPAQYNLESTHTVDIQAGPNQFNLELVVN